MLDNCKKILSCHLYSAVQCTAGRYTINRPKVCCLMHRTHSALCVGHASILPIPFNKKLVSVPPASHVNIRAVHTVSIFYSKVNIKLKKVWNKKLTLM